MFLRRRATRDALILALMGRPAGLPAPERVDLARFWARFDASAPGHVRLGLGMCTLVLGHLMPRLWGHRSGLARLGVGEAEAVVERAAGTPALRPLVDAALVVASFAYLSDPRVEAAVRGPLRVGQGS